MPFHFLISPHRWLLANDINTLCYQRLSQLPQAMRHGDKNTLGLAERIVNDASCDELLLIIDKLTRICFKDREEKFIRASSQDFLGDILVAYARKFEAATVFDAYQKDQLNTLMLSSNTQTIIGLIATIAQEFDTKNQEQQLNKASYHETLPANLGIKMWGSIIGDGLFKQQVSDQEVYLKSDAFNKDAATLAAIFNNNCPTTVIASLPVQGNADSACDELLGQVADIKPPKVATIDALVKQHLGLDKAYSSGFLSIGKGYSAKHLQAKITALFDTEPQHCLDCIHYYLATLPNNEIYYSKEQLAFTTALNTLESKSLAGTLLSPCQSLEQAQQQVFDLYIEGYYSARWDQNTDGVFIVSLSQDEETLYQVWQQFAEKTLPEHTPTHKDRRKTVPIKAQPSMVDSESLLFQLGKQASQSALERKNRSSEELLEKITQHNAGDSLAWLERININTTINGAPLLCVAAMQAKCDIVESLFEKGAQIDSKNRQGNTALFMVLEQAITIIKQQAPSDHQLQQATLWLKLASRLIEQGADPDIDNGDGQSARVLLTKTFLQQEASQKHIKQFKNLVELTVPVETLNMSI